jgi:hypothetical protein
VEDFMGPWDYLTAEAGVNDTLQTGYWKDEDGAEIQVAMESSILRHGNVKEKRYIPSNLSAFELLKRRIERRIQAFRQ